MFFNLEANGGPVGPVSGFGSFVAGEMRPNGLQHLQMYRIRDVRRAQIFTLPEAYLASTKHQLPLVLERIIFELGGAHQQGPQDSCVEILKDQCIIPTV